jgi:DNA polymerase elongation subunit (family B)
MSKPFYTSVTRVHDYIYFRGYNNGRSVQERVKYKPTFYLPSPEPTKFKSLAGSYLADMDFDTMAEANDFLKRHKGIENFEIHGNTNFVQQFISDAFKGVIEFERDSINLTTIDIEVQSDQGFPKPDEANHPVTAITIKNNIDNVYYVWGMGDWDKDKSIVSELDVVYVKCVSEGDLLHKFMDRWAASYPDAVTGWNSRMFDIVYLVNRITKVLGDGHANKLSPWFHKMRNPIREREIRIGQQMVQVFEIAGIEQLDYLDLFKKFAYSYGTQESYKLDHIAHVVLGDSKIDYSEYGSLNELYLKDFQKFIDYNIKDVEIVDRLEDKMALATLCMTVAYKGKVNFSDSFGSVAIWDALIYNELRARGVICPPKKDNTKERKIEGAHVKDPYVGMHDWVMSFDLNSLYPHIIMQYNMSPETVVNSRHQFDLGTKYHAPVEYLLDNQDVTIDPNYSMAGTGQFFDRTKRGLFPELVDNLYNERKGYKKQMLAVEQRIQDEGSSYDLEKEVTTLDNKQMAIKILMNSLYGAMSNEYFRYYDIRIAEGITVSGQLTIRWAEKHLNQYMNKVLGTDNQDYVIAIDTDSLYINMGSLIEKVNPKDPVKFLDKVAEEKIVPLLSKSYDHLKDYLNAYEQKMVMAREVIASKGVWTGKKHYVLNVHNSEGVQYKEPKLKMMGIEAVRSSTPQVCRNMFKDVLKVILESNEAETQEYIRKLREDFNNTPVEDISFPRSVNRLEFYKDPTMLYKKGSPIQVRAALTYNHYVDQHKLANKYEKIHSGEKIKFCYLKQPNKVQSNVIAFSSVLPDEFDIRQYVDYDTQFEKAFIEPVKSILDAVGWDIEPRATLEAWFT